MVEDPEAVEQLLRSQAARRSSRDQLSRGNPDFDAVSPEAGRLDAALAALTGKVTLADGVARPVEDVVADIWRRAGEELGKA